MATIIHACNNLIEVNNKILRDKMRFFNRPLGNRTEMEKVFF